MAEQETVVMTLAEWRINKSHIKHTMAVWNTRQIYSIQYRPRFDDFRVRFVTDKRKKHYLLSTASVTLYLAPAAKS